MLLYYPDGTRRNIPSIDAEAHIRIHGASLEPIAVIPPTEIHALQEKEEAPQGQVTIHAAILSLINQAQKIYELEPIPTVGKAAAAAILENRPEGGYKSLNDLAPILPARSSLDAIKSWGGPSPEQG